jgi:protein-tyrosine phosphatase
MSNILACINFEEEFRKHMEKFAHLKHIPKEANILFICVGNINRSPAAQIILEAMIEDAELFQGWTVDSAAISEKNEGKLMAKKMRDILEKMGWGIIGEWPRSKPVTKEMVDAATNIFIMDKANEKKMVDKFGETVLAKLSYIGDWQNRWDRNIPDPAFAKGTGQHEEVVLMLEAALHNLVGLHDDIYSTNIENDR